MDLAMAVEELANVSNQQITSNLYWPQDNGIMLSRENGLYLEIEPQI